MPQAKETPMIAVAIQGPVVQKERVNEINIY